MTATAALHRVRAESVSRTVTIPAPPLWLERDYDNGRYTSTCRFELQEITVQAGHGQYATANSFDAADLAGVLEEVMNTGLENAVVTARYAYDDAVNGDEVERTLQLFIRKGEWE